MIAQHTSRSATVTGDREFGLAVAGDAVADLVEATELLDVDVDELAGMLAFVAPHRLGRLESCARTWSRL